VNSAIILAVICVVAAFAVYYPFITKYDKELLLEEQQREAAVEGDDDDFFSF
jgi:PTS system cellobiose-specific IIC component